MPETTGSAPEAVGASPQPSLLSLFPRKLQDIIVDSVLETRCERATDIWYEQQPAKTVVVLRGGMQWFLNESASILWLGADRPIRELVLELAGESSHEKKREVALAVVDYLLLAAGNGLLTLFPEEALAERGEPRQAMAEKGEPKAAKKP